MRTLTLVFFTLVTWANAQHDYPEWFYGTFPDDFQWGLATASYQIEGAHNADGKGPNIWDTFTHSVPSPIYDGSNGDIACDSYNKYQVDVQLLKNMGADYYRFSVSWSRILPTGTIAGGVNELGIAYYNNLINDLIANDIEPMITMYHWDLPQALQDVNGWQNDAIADEFEQYANLLYTNFGDRIKKWITFNEPWVTCVMGHGSGEHAPGLKIPSTAPYKCAHNILRSHGKAYKLYQNSYKASQGGVVGITLDSANYVAKDRNDPEHVAAADRAVQFKHGWFAFPIFKGGEYPPAMRELIDRKSSEDNLTDSRLPTFTQEEKEMISGSSDFLGFNHYTTELVEPAENSERSWGGDQNTATSHDASWPQSASTWLRHVPWGFRMLLNYFKDTYDNPIVYVTENGFSDTEDVRLNDEGRVKYYREYINEMLKAVVIDNCNVKSYTAWSLIDNFEWARGYSERFGVHWVNFSHPDRPRVAKQSAILLKEIFANNGFPDNTESSSSTTLVLGFITYGFAFVIYLYGKLF